jgi:predicted transcriptional regulator
MPRATNSVTDTELAILQVLWDRESATVREIVEEIYEQHTHSLHASIKSLLERLAEKGYVTCQRQGMAHVFSSLVDREAFVSQQLQVIADTNFGGSLTPLLLTLIDNVKFSREDRESVRRMIENID